MISESKPMSGARKEPKTVRFDDRKKEPRIGENILDHDLDEGEVRNPMNQVKIFTGQDTHRDLAEAQMEGGFTFSGSGHSYNALGSSDQACSTSEPLNCAPPKNVRVVRFPKESDVPIFEKRQTVDVKADKHHGDAKLNHIPDFREDWGNGDSWQLHRKAYRVHVGSADISDVELHGTYVVFATYDPSYGPSTHKMFIGQGRHVHKDFFIAKIGKYRDGNGWTVYVDMPDEFLSPRPKDRLESIRSSMVGLLRTW